MVDFTPDPIPRHCDCLANDQMPLYLAIDFLLIKYYGRHALPEVLAYLILGYVDLDWQEQGGLLLEKASMAYLLPSVVMCVTMWLNTFPMSSLLAWVH